MLIVLALLAALAVGGLLLADRGGWAVAAAPPGREVSLTYDARVTVEVGDAIITTSGRVYLVVKARQQERGKWVGRWHLRCVVLASEDELEPGTRRHRLRWYWREKRRGRPFPSA